MVSRSNAAIAPVCGADTDCRTLSASLFNITVARIFLGEQLLPTATPLPSCAYPLLVTTFFGWIWTFGANEHNSSACHKRPSD
jgi:hypothetical protein